MIEVLVPRESVNDQSVVVQRVLISDGDAADLDQIVVEVETSKTVIEISAPAPGIIRHTLKTGQEVVVGTPLFSIDVAPAGPTDVDEWAGPSSPLKSAAPPAELRSVVNEKAILSNAARDAADRLGVDLGPFAGRWVTEAEIVNGHGAEEPTPAPSGAGQIEKQPDFLRQPDPAVPFEAIPQSPRKRAEIESLLVGQHAATTSTIGVEVTLPGERLSPAEFLFKDSISDLVVFEASRLFAEFPELNGFNIDGRSVGRFRDVNFGLSFDNNRNLKVLALGRSDRVSLPEIQRQFLNLLEQYESGRPLEAALLTSATVTMSDLSATAACFMLPLLNGRQALNLGVVRHTSKRFAIFASFDHRVTEGLRVARFLERLRERIVSHYRDDQGRALLSCDGCGKSMADEIRLGGRGFIGIVLPTGAQAHVCRNCLEGR